MKIRSGDFVKVINIQGIKDKDKCGVLNSKFTVMDVEDYITLHGCSFRFDEEDLVFIRRRVLENLLLFVLC